MKVTNGKDVARLLVDEYLNCHPTGHKKFMESMAKEQQEIKDNYTYLGFAWLKGLSEVRYYDLRNEASKLMADDLCLHVKEQKGCAWCMKVQRKWRSILQMKSRWQKCLPATCLQEVWTDMGNLWIMPLIPTGHCSRT